MSSNKIRVGIIGASGFVGGELLRILLRHPNVEITVATSREYKGEYVFKIHPHLRGQTMLRFVEPDIDKISNSCDVVFLAVPHGQSLHMVPKLLELGLRVLDLSADYRLKDPEAYVRWYDWREPHPYPDLLKKAVYGLPEIHRDELRNANLVAVAGCMATAGILSLLPLVRHRLIEFDKIVIDAKIGSSGAGAHAPRLDLHAYRTYVVRPYEVTEHRHIAEIEQELSLAAGEPVKVAFTPHAVDIVRGILVTSHSWARGSVTEPQLWKSFRETYLNEPFVRIARDKTGMHRYPDVKYVIGSNYCDVGFDIDSRLGRIVTFAAIDNLMKGAAGQAVQCFNIMMGFDERTALDLCPLFPV